MTPSLINDKDTLREYVRINFINDDSSLPDFELAAQKYLVPILGVEQYEDLLDQVINHDFPAEGTPVEDVPEIEDEVLVKKCRAVIAPLAYRDELPTIHTQITDAGLRTAGTDSLQAAHRWEYNKVEKSLDDKGAYALNDLLQFLFKHKEDYPIWLDSDPYKELSSLLFKNGDEFNKYYRVVNPYQVWWQLRTLIVEVEDLYIHSTIGEDFYKELVEAEEPNPAEIKAIGLLKKSIAQFVIAKAVEKKSVEITPQGLVILMSAGSGDAANAGDHPQRDNQLSLLYDSCDRGGNSYLVKLQEFLNENASAEKFATYFTSECYRPASQVVVNPNKKRRIYGL